MKENLFNLIRKYLLIYLTGNLGKVEETDDKIICYVKKNKGKKDGVGKVFSCFGIRSDEQELADIYHINKPICYVFDKMDFKNNHICIFGYDDCEVIVKDCRFEYGLSVHISGDCILDNNYIEPFLGQFSVGADNLILKNLKINNKYKLIGEKLGIVIGTTEDLDIIDCEIGKLNEKTSIALFSTDKMNIVNSKINGNVVKCGAANFQVDKDSEINASSKIEIEAGEFSEIKVNTPKVVCNGRIFNSEDGNVVLKIIDSDLDLKRRELIELLKKIKNDCQITNNQELQVCENNLLNKPISKVLKK